jgi:hypothetical protein
MSRTKAQVGVAALVVAAACWITALAAAAPPGPPPNFDVVTSGPVGFGVDPVACPGGFVITSVAPAQGTHIGGNGTLAARECAQPDFVNGINHISGEGVITSTDGAQLFYDYGGTAPLPDLSTGTIGEQLSYTITGGTGRFADASGGGRLSTHGNFFVSVTAELAGTLQLHG